MSTPRTLLLLLLAVGLGCVPGTGRGVSEPDPAAHCRASGKPQGPVALAWERSPGATGGEILRATLRPTRRLSSLAWTWELSGGAILLEGAAGGTASVMAGESTELNALLLPPNGGRPGRAALVVTAVFEGAGPEGATGPESTIQSLELSWGEPDLPSVVIETEGGELAPGSTSLAVVPSAHRPGR